MFWFRCGGIIGRRGRYRITPWLFCFVIFIFFIVLSLTSTRGREKTPPLFHIQDDPMVFKIKKSVSPSYKRQADQSFFSVLKQSPKPETKKATQMVQQTTTTTEPQFIPKQSLDSDEKEVSSLTLPSILNYLPHLAIHHNHLNPIKQTNLSVTSRLTKPNIAIGIPTVRRQTHSYLVETLSSLLSNLPSQDKNKVVFIIYIGENKREYIDEIMRQVIVKFPLEVKTGLVDIIAPPLFYYPMLDNLPSTFGDPKERVKWRAKQNLDYAYLMMYSQNKAMYYMQLEDDVIAAPGYIRRIEDFIRNRPTNWFMLEFCRLGFIGKMFHVNDLQDLIEFFLMFYKQKPNDWLLDHYVEVRVCSPEKGRKECNQEKNKIRIPSRPSLFQHVGKESSLKGKTQKLVDRGFYQNKQQIRKDQFVSHKNPKAQAITNCDIYVPFHLQSAYDGKNFAWIKTPKNDSLITFRFEKPIRLKTFLFRTGNHDHPGDLLKFGVVEALTKDKHSKVVTNAEQLKVDIGLHTIPLEDYVILGVFNEKGFVEGKVPESLGQIVELRIRVTLDVIKNWVIISEFMIT